MSSNKDLRVAIAHDFVCAGGADKVLQDMHNLWPEAPVYTFFKEDREIYREGWDIRTSWLQPFLKQGGYRWPFPLYPSLTDRMAKQIDWDIDLLLTSSVSYVKNIVAPPSVPHVCYIYRAAMFAYDRQEMFLSGYPAVLRPILRHYCNRFRTWDQSRANNPDLYITLSKYVADMVKRVYGVDSRIVFPGVNLHPFREAGLKTKPGDYYFCAVRLEGYKRVDLIIEACNRLQIKLKIAGTGSYREELEKLAGPTVEFVGFVPDEEMPGLYAGAKAFLFPSEEDFGIAPVEALAAGRPVIALNKGGPAETVIHGETGIHFAEQTLEDVMQAIQAVETTTWNAERIRESAHAYSTEVFNESMRSIVDEYTSR